MPNDNDTMLDWFPQATPWKNFHETVQGPIKGTFNLWPPADGARYGADFINRCTRQIQRALADAKSKGHGARAMGRGWSLSEAPVADNGAMIDLSRLYGMKQLRENQLDPAYQGDADAKDGLFLIQGGAYVSEINKTLESDQFGRSLRTTGAANGQTITGATSTGTHGSALEFGALHDHIVAIHLIAGPNRQVWLERASYPVLKPSLAGSLNADFIRDDTLFNAVLVGVGAFGVIHNVVIETRPRFLLNSISYDKDQSGAKLVLNNNMREVISALDFSKLPALNPALPAGKPYFFQPIIDPNTNPPEVLITLMYEEPWDAGYVPDYRMAEAKFGPGYDFLSVMGLLLDVFKAGVPMFSQVAKAELFDTKPKRGSWGELFGFKTPRTKVASAAVAVPLNKALETLDILIALNGQVGPAPLVFGCRYVKKSPALLAMNRFDDNFVVSIDGVYNDTALNFFDAVPGAMEAAGIPYTQHWGKSNGYTKPRLQSIFGADLVAWKNARQTLLPDADDRKLFENEYMKRCGLAD